MRRILTTLFLLSLTLNFILFKIIKAEDLSSNNFIIRGPNFSSGGGWSNSDNFKSFVVFGQTLTGDSTSANFESQIGFGNIHDSVFSLSSPSSASFESLNISPQTQNSSASIPSVTVTNTRGTDTAWSLSMTVTNLTKKGSSYLLAGSNNTVTFSGNYTGVNAPTTSAGRYVAEVTSSGAVGSAIFKWTDPNGTLTTGITTAASVALNSGVYVNFGSANYNSGDKWSLVVDKLSYNNLTLTPGSIGINFGDDNISAGSSGVFSGSGITSDPRTLINANANTGEGQYVQEEVLSQSVHGGTLEGNFSGTVTLTLS
jgi:hypothetical protein